MNLIGDPKPITVSATLPKSASLDKTTLSTDGKVCWESDDKITVNGTELGISAILSETCAVFEGSVGSITTTYGRGYWATYPTSLNATGYTSSSVNVTIPPAQTYNGDSIPNYMAAFNTAADGDNLNLQFKNLCCIIRFQVKSQDNDNKPENTLSEIEVVSSQNIAGTATVQMGGSGPEFVSWINGGGVLTLDCGDTRLNSGTDITFYVMVPAGTQDLTVKFYDATGKYMCKTVSSAALARNNIYTLSAILNATEEAPAHLSGLFSVSPTKKVYFSIGNLQWSATGGGSIATTHAVAGGGIAVGTWRFSKHQWDFVGDATMGNVYAGGVKCNNEYISSTYTGWIDLFGWGTSGYNGKYPYMTSSNVLDYWSGGLGASDPDSNYNWGRYNAISNGGNQPGLWRVLEHTEWFYLMNTRTNASEKYGPACVNGVNGMIILPDEFSVPTGFHFVHGMGPGSKYSDNTYTITEWLTLENGGAVFLPAGGRRVKDNNTNQCTVIDLVGQYAAFWGENVDARGEFPLITTVPTYFYYVADGCYPSSDYFSENGLAVRLVRDAN